MADPAHVEAAARLLRAAPLTARKLAAGLRKGGVPLEKKDVNALLYGNPALFRRTADFEATSHWELVPGAAQAQGGPAAPAATLFECVPELPALNCRVHAGGDLTHFLTVPYAQSRLDLQLQKEGEGRYPTLRAISGVPTAGGALPQVTALDALSDRAQLEALTSPAQALTDPAQLGAVDTVPGAALVLLTDGGPPRELDLAATLCVLLFRRAGKPVLYTEPGV